MIDRRRFLLQATTALAAALMPSRARSGSPCPRPAQIQAVPFKTLATPEAKLEQLAVDFQKWLFEHVTAKEGPVTNLVYNFYDPTKQQARWIYPMLSGKAILWLLQRGKVKVAQQIARPLLLWQQPLKEGAAARSFGAFPSKIERKGNRWWHGTRYYSGDNLVILEALTALYEQTKEPELLNGAVGVGTWLTSVMCNGKQYGVWKEDHGAPMYFVTRDGQFSNHIHGNVEMLWIGALKRLSAVTGEEAYCQQADRAVAFYRMSQHANGSFYDHYDPGYPPTRYDRTAWKAYQPGQLISDNQLRSALGLCRIGDLEGARRFYRWLKVDPKGGIPAYLDQRTGETGFPKPAETYFDAASSALHRSLCQWLGETKAAQRDIEFLRQVRHPNGGWHWGIRRSDMTARTPEQAPVVGFWATADLSTHIG